MLNWPRTLQTGREVGARKSSSFRLKKVGFRDVAWTVKNQCLERRICRSQNVRMKIGYARVSTVDQNPALQLDALRRAGCERVYTDEGISGATVLRPALQKTIARLKSGDVLVVWKLDRLGRSLSHLIALTSDLAQRGIGFESLSESIATTSAHGKLLLHLLGALAEFERALIAERTRAGIQAAKRRGVQLGRKRKLSANQVKLARRLLAAGDAPADVARNLNISKTTLYRALDESEHTLVNADRTSGRDALPNSEASNVG